MIEAELICGTCKAFMGHVPADGGPYYAICRQCAVEQAEWTMSHRVEIVGAANTVHLAAPAEQE